MKKIIEILNYYFNIICLVALAFLITGIVVLIYNDIYDRIDSESNNKKTVVEVTEQVQTSNFIYKVDIKGAVKKPGVYEIQRNNNVSDLIKLAGGLTKNADTSNINLSRILEDQMVIKISTKSELKNLKNKEISECVCPEVTVTECVQKESAITKIEGETKNIMQSTPSDVTNITETNENTTKLVSINTATKEELMTLNSIGESKANAIIEYRNTNGNFKSIEEIKNVSGIGEALFEKIKSSITI